MNTSPPQKASPVENCCFAGFLMLLGAHAVIRYLDTGTFETKHMVYYGTDALVIALVQLIGGAIILGASLRIHWKPSRQTAERVK